MSGDEQDLNPQSSANADSWVDPLRSEDTNEMVTSVFMEEIVKFSTRQVLKRTLLNALWMPTVLASLIGGMGLIMSIGFTLAGLLPHRPIWLQIGGLPVMLFGVSWVMGLMVCAPMAAIASLPTKRRKIWLEHGRIIQQTSCRTTKLSLDASTWEVTNRASDIGGRYFGHGRLIQIQCDQNVIVCGFSEAKREEWVHALADSAAHSVTPTERRRFWLYSTGISLMTGCLGAVVGVGLSRVTNDRWWTASGTMIGFLDGAIFSVGLFYWARRGEKAIRSRYGPFMCSLLFLVTGVTFTVGLDAKLIAGLSNAGIGWFCGRFVTEKAKSLAMEAGTENLQTAPDTMSPPI